MADDARMLGYIVVRPNPNLGVGWSIVDRTLWADSKDATAWADEAIGEGRYRVARCVVLTWPIIHDGRDTWDEAADAARLGYIPTAAPPEAREERSGEEWRTMTTPVHLLREWKENERSRADRRTQPNRGRGARKA